MSRTSRHRILAAMLSACLLSLLGGCTPLTVLAVLGGCKDGGSNGSSGGTTGSVVTGEVRDGMTIAQTKAWFNGSDGPDNVCQAYPDGQCTWWACMPLLPSSRVKSRMRNSPFTATLSPFST